MDLRSWPSSVKTSNFLCPSLYTLLQSAVVWKSFALEPSDSVKGWLVNHSPAPESTTRGFGNGGPSVLFNLAQVRIALLEEIDVCICQAGKTYTWLLGGEISRSLPLSAITLTTTAFATDIVFQGRTVLIPNNPMLCQCLGPLPLDPQRICMFVLVDVLSSHAAELCNMFDGNTPITVSHSILLSRQFPSREHRTASSHVPNCSFLLALVAPNLLPEVFQCFLYPLGQRRMCCF